MAKKSLTKQDLMKLAGTVIVSVAVIAAAEYTDRVFNPDNDIVSVAE